MHKNAVYRILVVLLVVFYGFAGASEDASLTNSLGMTLVRIAPGSFQMGSTNGDYDEMPVHEVTLSRPFYMSATPVTNAQYEAFDPAHRALRGKRGLSKEDDEAVIFVSWLEAADFCDWLSEKEGKPYRLPTEAEWEYACRAGKPVTETHARVSAGGTDGRQSVGPDGHARAGGGVVPGRLWPLSGSQTNGPHRL